MPEDETGDQGFIEEMPSIEHDDIMKRLRAYQERLREDLAAREPPAAPSPWSTPDEAPAGEDQPVATATEDLADVGSAETSAEQASVTASDPRVADLEATLADIDTMLGDLRQRFQDMAIAADERLAAIQDAIAEARGKHETL